MFSLSSYFSVEYMLILLPLSVGLYLILPSAETAARKPAAVQLCIFLGSQR